ncbi:MAG: PTS sugar transporter subunit IIA [Spirochaetes bacterium]|nr:PTS sugar transporter subunit IIA [Spirochaetota bacterium]MBL7007203.1 PTS sugar transporter subunit IIA [Spirochaetia bacterium]
MEYNDNLMTLAEVATFLKLSEKTILKMIRNQEIPCAKIANQWRFLRPLIEDWLLAKMNVIPQNDLSRLIVEQYDHVPLSRLISIPIITVLPEKTDKQEALYLLTSLASEQNIISDKEAVYQKLIEREQMISTGIGNGIAIPHMRNPSSLVINGPKIVIGVSKNGIAYASSDNQPVFLIFLILTDSEVVHLRIMAKLVQMIRKNSMATKLLQADTPQKIFQQIALFERDELLAQED